MATLNSLKETLWRKASIPTSLSMELLSDEQYSTGFDILVQGSGWRIYRDFIIPHLSHLLAPLFNSRDGDRISVMEVGPGQISVLEYLPLHLRKRISKYSAFEPNKLYATRLEERLCSKSETGYRLLPGLESPPSIRRAPFVLYSVKESDLDGSEKFDVILFCHSMYGMADKEKVIKQAVEMLVELPKNGMVTVFHRDGTLHLPGLVCHQTASFPPGTVFVANEDKVLDNFASFVVGFGVEGLDSEALRTEWRNVCRILGRREEAHPNKLLFSSPEIMMAFTRNSTALPECVTQVAILEGGRTIKNREARLHHPASTVSPKNIEDVQECVRWALKHNLALSIIGGGHSGHCVLPNVVAVDMSAFNQVHIVTGEDGDQACSGASKSLLVAEAGCKTEDIVRRAMAAGFTVPLGSRPSVGAGLWLQGGIGHLARLHGLACDAIVGAVVVSVKSGEILCIGDVPIDHRPAGATFPNNETDILWAIKGAGTNFGIVMSVVFKVFAALTYETRSWSIPLEHEWEARSVMNQFDSDVALKLPRNHSADAYLYWEMGKLRFGITMFEAYVPGEPRTSPDNPYCLKAKSLESLARPRTMNSVDLFDAEMYMSEMHGGHGGGKTSAFKRCLLLKGIANLDVQDALVAAIKTRPTSSCYLHLLHGGGAICDVAANATAFGCRDWNFACVITGVWLRDQDETEISQAAIQWVYKVAGNLLPLSSGVYSADLGPDPRDAILVTKAFGPNRSRLNHLKHSLDPHNVLAYACPLQKVSMGQKVIILVTGESCAGKDHCADIWVSEFISGTHQNITARSVSISDATKREYAATTGADLTRLLQDRVYKEQHRSALTTFFQSQLRDRPGLLEEHFLKVVSDAVDVDVLLITGMRDEAPVAAYSHLVPDSRLLEVHVRAEKETRLTRRGYQGGDNVGDYGNEEKRKDHDDSIQLGVDYPPTFIFDNDADGSNAIKVFAQQRLFPFFENDFRRLVDMVRVVPNFPRLGIDFHDVLNISQQPGGLALSTSLLKSTFNGDWEKIKTIACCEAGGFVFASTLALLVDVPLALIREAGKRPPPMISSFKPESHISSKSTISQGSKIEMDQYLIPRGASVLVVDDVLATGKTLCAVLWQLEKTGVCAKDISVMVVAEFPYHRGREFLRRQGFGEVSIQSLLVFDGA
ncbi:hypothetical protein N7466_004594 [Penicillium verhagenii]|uniref:uncharacterized protein n=1 Tax=Penicillium verhagenii TaxID=1562060 RepID=UPI0025456966|nr:uncharacterized protein N7466_004594 [Penicillium verhagenii]KAJ5935047.1 hypothetical protein N7466_004594 [Penicillium verhagenii]